MSEAKEKELADVYTENTKLQVRIMVLRRQIKDKDERIKTLQNKARELMKN